MTTITTAVLNEYLTGLDLTGERQSQDILSRFPQFLIQAFGGRVAIPKYRLGTEFETDFLLYSTDSLGLHVILVELEPPTARPFTKAGNYTRRLNEALNQVHEWLAWIDRNEDYFLSRLSDAIKGARPGVDRLLPPYKWAQERRSMVEAKIVIGRREHLTTSTDRKRYSIFSSSQGRIEVTNYDRLLDAGIELCAQFMNQEGSSQQLGRAARSKFIEVRREVATSPRASARTLERLSGDVVADVREAVAGNPKTSPNILDSLAMDSIWRVRQQVARNSRTRVKALEELFRDPEQAVKIQVVRNHRCPWRLLAEAAGIGDPVLRRHAAKNPNLGVETQNVLAEDEDVDVRRILARNSSLSNQIAFRMLGDPDKLVRLGLYRVQSLPEEDVLAGLRREPSWIRATIAQDQNLTSGIILAELARDSAVMVRVAVARNPNLPKKLRDAMCRDEDERVREAAKGKG